MEVVLAPFKTLRSTLTRDGCLLFSARALRLTAYGWVAVGLILHLNTSLESNAIGWLFTGILVGDLIITLVLTTHADSFGRKKTLMIGALLMLIAGIVFALTGELWLLLIAGIIGVISPSGGEIGPFLACEQAGLTQLLKENATSAEVTTVLSWYNLIGYVAMAIGGLVGGALNQALLDANPSSPDSAYVSALYAYAACAAVMLVLYAFLTKAIEAPVAPLTINDELTPAAPAKVNRLIAHFSGIKKRETQKIVAKLSVLFTLDSFGGGFVLQSIIAFWLNKRYGTSEVLVGTVLFVVNIVSAISTLCVGPLAKRIGLVNTMVWTHLPSNVLLILVPLMDNEWLSMLMIILRFCISQMDVPSRQAFVVKVVPADERSAASGITNVIRSIGVAISPGLAQMCFQYPPDSFMFKLPFILSGGIKIIYDLLIWYSMKAVDIDAPAAVVEKSKEETTPAVVVDDNDKTVALEKDDDSMTVVLLDPDTSQTKEDTHE